MLMTKDITFDKGHFVVFPKEKGRFFIMPCFTFGHALLHFAMLLLTQSAPKTRILSSTIHSPHFADKKMKFTIHLSLFTVTIHPLLFITLFTPNFCLFKGGCPLYLKQVLVELSSGLLSQRELFFVSFSLRDFITYYNFPTIPTKLVTSSSS